MSVLKCKMCGGDLVITPGTTICECEYCGSKQTIPNTDDEKRLKLYERANKLRFNCEFDKAAGVYESIVSEFQDEAEAYWGLVLCKYGIEYVDDPKTGKKIPTCHRSSFDSVMDDVHFELVMENADTISRGVYREEAKQIEELRKGIIEVSSKEEPYDIFICYKETADDGQRTIDSVIAQDVYDALTEEGYKVFFSRITLEDKLGQEYEPYIFAALNSAKVMLAFGTQYDYYNAVWVKNEWSRFLQLMEAGHKKTLIPCYKNIDAYDMPKEFAKLQAQDMGKVGAIQDLIRGIRKIIPIGEPKIVHMEPGPASVGESVGPLLERAFIYLEDGEFREANEYCEKVLNQEPKNAKAYLGKLMVEMKVRKPEDLAECEESFEESSNFQKAIRFGDEALSFTLKEYSDQIVERKKNKKLSDIYEKATELMKRACESSTAEELYKSAAKEFSSVTEYKDADNLVTICMNLAEESRKDTVYNSAKQKIETEDVSSVEVAVELLQSISGWKNADDLLLTAREKLIELNNKNEEERLEREKKAEQARILTEKAAQRRKRVLIISAALMAVVVIGVIVFRPVLVKNQMYKDAISFVNAKDYESAYNLLENLNYKDSKQLRESIEKQYYKSKLYNEAKIGSYVEFGSYIQKANESDGKNAIEWYVLDKNDDSILLLSKYVLDSLPYHSENIAVEWGGSSLYDWLNKTFSDAAFEENEKDLILPGQIFLLSADEVERYLPKEESRKCSPTLYAKGKGCVMNDNTVDAPQQEYYYVDAYCSWWLSTKGTYDNYAEYVTPFGDINSRGRDVDDHGIGVRPAIRISISEE